MSPTPPPHTGWKQPCSHPALPAWAASSGIAPCCDPSGVAQKRCPPTPICSSLPSCLCGWEREFLALLIYFTLSLCSLARGGRGFLVSVPGLIFCQEKGRKTPRHGPLACLDSPPPGRLASGRAEAKQRWLYCLERAWRSHDHAVFLLVVMPGRGLWSK